VSEWLLSVGLDVGTTSTQMVVSQLEIENTASGFTVPEMVIAQRQVRYRSPVHFTPLVGENLVDGQGIREMVLEEYRQAGICREDVDTGAVIITGETSRRENAGAVLAALSDFAGDFVVATAGPELESVLAAKGAGAVAFSEETGETVLHMDIGGGTSNLALIKDGEIVETGCLNVGGRLVKFGENRVVTYVSPVLQGVYPLQVGETIAKDRLEELAQVLVEALEMAAGLREKTDLLEKLWTKETESRFSKGGCSQWGRKGEESEDTASMQGQIPHPSVASDASSPQGEAWVISFSGGVADCIEKEQDWLSFGDIGPILGQSIRKSRLCQGAYRLGDETIRATVIGAGCHSAQLSGSTVFHRNVEFPLKNKPVVRISKDEQVLPTEELAALVSRRLVKHDTEAVVALPGFSAPGYETVKTLAKALVMGMGQQQVLTAVEKDMAKALGQAMALLLPPEGACLCIDTVKLTDGSFLDVGAPVGPAMPVVVKTLVLGN